ncbi:GMC oxidoreductase [Amycolatopsis sp. NPDC051102]|uniref:GMC oxidoreductase n=1 Tax=Amycolatopsis sp. NPDC051102 TaxID=3155163 RepID=UPI00341F57D3
MSRGAAEPVREERRRVVIIGSGVGGSIAAFRLAEAGVDNVVLERGRRWPIAAERAASPWGKELLWGHTARPSLRPRAGVTATAARLAVARAVARAKGHTGPLELLVHPELVVACGAAVGGGTLVYGGVLGQPHPGPFSRVFPAELDYAELDAVYYPRARRRLVANAFPASLLPHPQYRDARLWHQALSAAGLAIEPIVGNFDVETIEAELAGRAAPAVTVGEYSLSGCVSGAKMSVDRTYLARAEATGRTDVRPLHLVTGIAEDRQGRYRVLTDRLGTDGAVVERLVLVCDQLVLAAGAVHTPRLLVAARDTGALPRLNEHVGRQWGTNGDQACILVTTAARGGPPPAGPPSYFGRDHDDTLSVLHGPLPLPGGMLLVLGMGLPDGFGQWHSIPASGATRLVWDAANDTTARRQFATTVGKIAAQLPGTRVLDPIGPHAAHPLGGVPLGKATDGNGRLHGYRGLYCLDAALMPGSTAAVNPVLTIAAVVERCLDHIIGDLADGGDATP